MVRMSSCDTDLLIFPEMTVRGCQVYCFINAGRCQRVTSDQLWQPWHGPWVTRSRLLSTPSVSKSQRLFNPHQGFVERRWEVHLCSWATLSPGAIRVPHLLLMQAIGLSAFLNFWTSRRALSICLHASLKGKKINVYIRKCAWIGLFPALETLSGASRHLGYFTLRELWVNVRVILLVRDTAWV